jgi:parvulin-like peptidyl-prolyl cis-trans isomerase-like protein
MISALRRWLREPLLHFLVLGAALFALHAWVGGATDDKEKIVVSAGQIDSLAAMFARTWMRAPTAEELAGLVRDYVREEVAYREALAAGLDRDDTIVRRRLRQKLEFIYEEVAQSEPGDAELAAYLALHRQAFRSEDRVTFTQVFVDPGAHGETLDDHAARLLARLRSGAGDPQRLSDATLLETRFEEATTADIAGTFGSDFVARLRAQAPGRWQGPLSSGYGLHLVKVDKWTPGAVPPLSSVREAVLREWQNEHRRAALDELYARLLDRYAVTVETADPTKRVSNARLEPARP